MAKNEVKSLRAKLVDIAHGIGTVEKSKRNPHFGYNYVGEGQLMAILGPKLAENKIMFSTSVLSCEPHYGAPGESKAGVFVMVTVECAFFDTDSNEELKVRGAGMGWDSGDKGVYKAITGAVKYVLMKNFMITDEQDPEAGEQRQPAASGHRQTREYEREGEREEQKQGKELTDLMQLSTWMQDNKVPESFVLAMLVEKKLINANVKKLGNVQPGILRRVLNPSSLERLKKAWDESKVPANGETRTSEGDQTPRGEMLRRFCKEEDISAEDYLDQEGVRDWREVKVPSGKNRGVRLGKLAIGSLKWYLENWTPEYRGKITDVAALFDAALCLAQAELLQHESEGGGYGD